MERVRCRLHLLRYVVADHAARQRGRNRPPQRVAFSTVVRSVLVVTAVSSVAIGTYFAFTDDVLTRLIGRQQNTYDDQIAKLRAQIDRIVSSQVLDQKQVEQQLTELLQRQKMLQQAFTGDLSATGTIKPERTAPPEAMPAAPPEANACRSTRGNACRSTRGNACRKTDDRIADQ